MPWIAGQGIDACPTRYVIAIAHLPRLLSLIVGFEEEDGVAVDCCCRSPPMSCCLPAVIRPRCPSLPRHGGDRCCSRCCRIWGFRVKDEDGFWKLLAGSSMEVLRLLVRRPLLTLGRRRGRWVAPPHTLLPASPSAVRRCRPPLRPAVRLSLDRKWFGGSHGFGSVAAEDLGIDRRRRGGGRMGLPLIWIGASLPPVVATARLTCLSPSGKKILPAAMAVGLGKKVEHLSSVL